MQDILWLHPCSLSISPQACSTEIWYGIGELRRNTQKILYIRPSSEVSPGARAWRRRKYTEHFIWQIFLAGCRFCDQHPNSCWSFLSACVAIITAFCWCPGAKNVLMKLPARTTKNGENLQNQDKWTFNVDGTTVKLTSKFTLVMKTRKSCCRKETARCRNCSFRFKLRRQHSLQV